MNNLAFQIYGTKKATPFQSVWKTDNIALGGELANRAASSLPTDWSGTNLLTGGYTHNGSGSSELLFSIGSAALQNYQIVCTLSAGSTGSVVIGLGNVSSVAISATTTIILTPTVGSGTLKITPVNFVGTVSLSVKQISSAVNQIQLPITSIPIGKSIWIDWGDNSYTNANNGNIIANRTHTYSTPGEYTVRILGDNFNFIFIDGFTNDRLKIKSISSWGKLKLIAGSFRNCSNVTMSGITDIPDLTGVTSLNATFLGCSAITTVGRMNEWNTSSVTNLSSMFEGARLFNQPIGNWDVSNVTTMRYMFQGGAIPMSFNQNIGSWDVRNVVNFDNFVGTANAKSSFNNGGSPDINNWIINTSADVNMAGMFSNCTDFNQPLNLWNTSRVTYMGGMFGSWVSPMKFNNGFASGNGIGNQLSWNTSNVTNMSFMFANNPAFNSNLGTGTTPWDVSKVTTFQSMFQGASNFRNGDDSAPINNWNIGGSVTGTITLESMFSSASAFNRDISGWDVSKVNTLSGIFANAINFENGLNTNINPVTLRAGLDGWNIVVTGNMYGVFLGASKFNRPLSNWNTTSVTWMLSMFQNAVLFNQDISSWNVGNVTNMGSMFSGAIQFNRDLSRWNVGKVTIFTAMFGGAIAFNNGSNSDTNPITLSTGINGWNIGTTAASVVTNQMFQNTNFNRYIGDWDVSKVTAMGNMFLSNGSFNQDLSKWNVGSVTSMEAMFYNTDAFTNGSNTNTNPVTGLTGINGWNINTSPTASVTMVNMFASNNAFNQPIGSWNVSRVTNMTDMFNNAIVFNQSLSNWERVSSPDTSTLANVTIMQRMFYGATAFNNGLAVGLPGTLTWNTIGVGNMLAMFTIATAFNQNIGSWNVSNCGTFNFMFRDATRFNNGNDASIGNWILKTTGSIDIGDMFHTATVFNQPIGSWNVSRVTNMFRTFQSATAFNQNIGAWNVSNVTNFAEFMLGKTFNDFSSTNLDAIYNGWIVNGVKPNISSPLSTNISFGTAKYSQTGKPGRDTLLASPNNWIITDGGNADPILNLDAGNPLSYPGTGALWTDLSGNNNNGTLVNGPTFDPANGGSIVFDGVNQYMTTLLNSSANNTTSIIWYKWDGVNKATSLTYLGSSGSTGLGFYINNGTNSNTAGNKISVLYGGAYFNALNSGTLYGTLVSGVYTQLTLTRDGSTTMLYQNGVFLGSTTRTPNNSTSNLSFNFSTDTIVGFPPVGGAVPLIQFYNRALSSTEVLANFNATKGRYGL